MQKISIYNESIVSFLSDLGVIAKIDGDVLAVDRTSMCHAVSHRGDESASYQDTLVLVREFMVDKGDFYIYWCGRNDEYLWLEIDLRESL